MRIEPGDQVVIRARLPAKSQLGRLYVFAKEARGEDFSPYVPRMTSFEEPSMATPVSLRLIDSHPEKRVSFTSDIDGYVCVMQEVDDFRDPLAHVNMRRIIDRNLNWRRRAARLINGMVPWKNWQNR
jgi:hypothetical protein